jgi:FAD/FMN-containing dehydrogenase
VTDQRFLEKLRRIVGPEHVSTGAVASAVYSYDASLASGSPSAVVFPADTAETAAVLRAASEERIPCTPRGFGTNLSGGSVPVQGGLVLCLSRLNRILDIQPARRCAVAQAGVTNLEL